MMATLLQVIFSETFYGTAPVAGGMYGAAYFQGGDRKRRSPRNMASGTAAQVVPMAVNFENQGKIDALSNLDGSSVYVLHAGNDEPEFGQEVLTFYTLLENQLG